MNFKTTLVLFAIVLGLCAFLWWKHDEVAVSPDKGLTSLCPFPSAKVETIRLKLLTGEEFALAKQGADWWLTEPVSDIAEQSVVADLMNALAQSVRFALDTTPSAAAMDALGLGGPKARITLEGGGETWSLRVGNRDASGGYVHAMVEGESSLLRTGANLSNLLAKPRAEWQSRRFIHGDGALVQRLVLERPGKPRVVLVRSGADWLLEEPLSFPAGSGAQRLLAIAMCTVRDFQRAKPSNDELLKVGLGDTATTLTFDWGTRQVVARFGISSRAEEQPVRYATDSERNYLFIVQGLPLDQLDLDAKDFRDPEVCRVTPTATRSIRFSRDGREVFALDYLPTDRRFDVTSPFHYPAVDDRTSPLYAFFQDVSALRAQSFLDEDELPEDLENPLASLGLDPPRAQLVIAKSESKDITREAIVEFGDPNGDGTVAVRRRDRFEHTIYNVPEADVAKVLAADPRAFLDPKLFPPVVAMTEVTIRAGGKSRTLRRDPIKEAPLWRDPAALDVDTNLFQQWISGLPGWQPERFLARDPLPQDGFDAPTATLELKASDPSLKGGMLHVTFGAKTAGGTSVLAQSDVFPDRTVFEVPAPIVDELVKLLP